MTPVIRVPPLAMAQDKLSPHELKHLGKVSKVGFIGEFVKTMGGDNS
jgi:hypothetical protein